MKNDKTIKLYVYVDGVNDVPFYGSDAGEYEAFILSNGEQFITSDGLIWNVRNIREQIEIGSFRYDAKRMGGAPTISFTLMYEECLDSFWNDNIYAKFNGEKYYLKQTPTSSYNNESTMYKHDLELVSERVILDNVYFFDAVVGDPQGDDKPVSNSTKVVFFGNIHEFVKRLNSSLEYAKLLKWEDGVDEDGNAIKIPNGYHVVVDNNENITIEEKLMSFEDQFFSNVLQEIYNTYEVPYYFEGKTIHIGYSNSDAVVPTFSYGVDDALLSITKNNANYKIVNRATATGSSDNIPFYYPNNSPKGEIAAISSSSNIEVTILDTELYSNEVKLDGVITRSNIDYENLEVKHLGESITSGETFSAGMGYGGISKDFFITFDSKDVGELSVSFASKVTKYILKDVEINDATFSVKYYMSLSTPSEDGYPLGRVVFTSGTLDSVEDVRIPIVKALDGYRLKITVSYAPTGKYAGKGGRIVYDASFDFGSESGWTYEGKSIELKDVGLKAEGTPSVGDTITQRLVKYVKTSQNLMPSIYRETDGAERFYNATNGTYEGIEFNNPYVEGRPKEHIFTVEDIKPTIEKTEVTQPAGSNFAGSSLRIDMFSEFAYDDDDNDETYEDEEGNVYFKHPYFYGKLRVMDFNLFDHAIEQQPMTISFTSGHCGACNFEIGVTEEYPQKNPVQVYEADTLIDGVLHKAGSLKRDENGMVLAGVEGTQQLVTTFQERQQDTSKYEVWIALKKEEETYGILMPQVAHRPKACTEGQNDGDTFVIIGINLPQSYIINAEKKLEAEIIKYLQDNNDEKFTFSIGFSRIYFEENNILDQLSENSKIRVIYDNKPYDLYVSSFSYILSEGDVLPEIRVELDETLKVSQNALQNAISQVKSELGRAIGSIDVVGAATPYFIRKDADDEAQGRINFKKGIKFGEGGKVEVLDNNSAKLTIEYLEVTKKASFTSLEIQEKTHVGGQILVTPAAINCGEVEEFDNYYRCYFQTKGPYGDEIFNQFAVGDQAICQTYNTWGSRYYWRKVVGIGEDYIDLSKVEGEFDEDSDAPMAGDKIIQLGNQTDTTRQNAIVIAAYGDSSPSLIMYNGIDSFSLVEKNITGIIWNPILEEPQLYSYGSFFFGDRNLEKNFITFQQKEGDTEKKLYINATVDFSSDSTGLSNLEEWKGVQSEISGINKTIERVQDQIDGVVENWNGEGTPTLTNEPAVNWLTDAEKIAHINDTYINIEEYVDDETTPTAGQAWRWCKCTNESITDFVTVTNKDGETFNLHWHQIADSDAVRALKEAATKADKSDLEVLTKNLKDGSTIVDGGLVMTSLVAVRNSEVEGGEIEAFLNGSSEFSDANHGKIILASGIPQEVNSNTDLQVRAQNAKTRICEDGVLYSKGGEFEDMSAISGKIGGFNLVDNWLKSDNENYRVSISGTTIQLKTQGDYQYSSDVTYNTSSTFRVFPVASTGGMQQCLQSLNTTIKQTRPTNYTDLMWDNSKINNIALYIKADGAEDAIVDPYWGDELRGGNFAIWAERGMYAGFRPMIRNVSKSTEINIYDHTLLVEPPVNTILNINLPEEQIIGQEYEIVMSNVYNVSFKHKLNTPNGETIIHWPQEDIWSASTVEMTAIGVVKIYGMKDREGNFRWWVYRLS